MKSITSWLECTFLFEVCRCQHMLAVCRCRRTFACFMQIVFSAGMQHRESNSLDVDTNPAIRGPRRSSDGQRVCETPRTSSIQQDLQAEASAARASGRGT